MTKLLNHFKQNLIAYLALFVALGGTSYAAVNLPAGSVGNRALKNHSITANKFQRSSIAGYMRDYAQISSSGQLVASRPRARLITWRTTGSLPGGLIQWSQPIPTSCFGLATTATQGTGASYASAQTESAGTRRDGQTYVLLSAPAQTVNVAVMCPQP